MSSIQKCVEEFEYYMYIEKNYSPKTIRTYRNGLNDFIKYLTDKEKIINTSLNEITCEHVKKYIVYLKNEATKSPNKPKTINLKISTLRSFYSFLINKGFLKANENITIELKHQKIPKNIPIYLTCEEAENFLLGIKLLSKNAKRDYAIFALFLLTGARLSEITNLKLEQINFKDKTVKLFGKGSKERVVPMVERAEFALLEYLKTDKYYIKRRKGKNEVMIEDTSLKGRTPNIETDVLFLNKYGRPITERGIQDLFHNLATKTGIFRIGLSVHKLRHTCFTLLFRAGVDILTIKNIAGHENIHTTEIYMHQNNSDVRRHMQLNPLNNKEYDNLLIQKIKENYLNKNN